jgi:ribosome-associated protein
MDQKFNERPFETEFIFSTSRSGGPGGQNVNKVSTKVELKFDVQNSALLTDEEKVIVQEKLSSRINKEGFLYLTAQETRSQLQNKQLVIEQFYQLLNGAFVKKKKRKPTKSTYTARLKRLTSKKQHGEKKSMRRKKDFGD